MATPTFINRCVTPLFNKGVYKDGGVWVPRAVRLLAEHGSDALKPKFDKGRYIGPLICRRIAANLRKRAIVEGTYGEFSPSYGGWDPAWDNIRKVYALRPHKGHTPDRNRQVRADKITKAMVGMPARIDKYKQEIIDRKPKKDLAYKFKRIEELYTVRSRSTK